MKKIIIFFVVILSIDSSATTNNLINYRNTSFSDTTVLPAILSLSLNSYVGKPVDSLFAKLPTNFTSRGFIPTGIGYCKGLSQSYFSSEFNTCYVEIFIDTFQLMTFPNRTKTTTWNMNLAKQETIAFIKVWKNNQCVYGCNNPNYY
jgi:hypothetical protein